MKKIVIICVIAALILGFFMLGLDRYFSLTHLKTHLSTLKSWHLAHPLLFALLFFISYFLVCALSLPGAAIMTLAAGAFFGLFWGTILASFASTLGATFAFLLSRYLLRQTVETRFKEKLQHINQGIEKEGIFYLFALRLVPVFPFFLINLLMGITQIRLRTFYWVSQIGMLLGTLVYVNAGQQLAQISTISHVFSLPILLSFSLLGLFPMFAKRLMTLFKTRQVYANWSKPKHFDRNLIVIGAGAAGLSSAYLACSLKAKVTLIESHKMGGDCLNYGCVPSKTLIKSAKLAHQIRHAKNAGFIPDVPPFSFRHVMDRVNAAIAQIAPNDSAERYRELGAEVLQGHAKFIDPWTIEVSHSTGNVTQLTAQNVILATGAAPVVPKIAGIDEVGYVTSDTLWQTLSQSEHLPEKIVILGGGPIGCELAQSFARLGALVTLIQTGPRIMPREDEEVSQFVHKTLIDDGVNVLVKQTILHCEVNNQKKSIVLSSADMERQSFDFELLICATGRAARLTGYGLELLGIETDKVLPTNAFLATKYPHIFAAGDVTGPYQFTHTASYQASYATLNALFRGFKKFKIDYNLIPWTTFVDPEVARIGLNETDAKAQNIAYEVTHFDLKHLDRAITDNCTAGFIKVLTQPGKDTILGVTIVAEHAGELLAEFALAINYGLGLNKILSTIHTYPTLSEANKMVAGVWRKNHIPQKLMQYLALFHRWRRKKV